MKRMLIEIEERQRSAGCDQGEEKNGQQRCGYAMWLAYSFQIGYWHVPEGLGEERSANSRLGERFPFRN